jgi:hypothetical protein
MMVSMDLDSEKRVVVLGVTGEGDPLRIGVGRLAELMIIAQESGLTSRQLVGLSNGGKVYRKGREVGCGDLGMAGDESLAVARYELELRLPNMDMTKLGVVTSRIEVANEVGGAMKEIKHGEEI